MTTESDPCSSSYFIFRFYLLVFLTAFPEHNVLLTELFPQEILEEGKQEYKTAGKIRSQTIQWIYSTT